MKTKVFSGLFCAVCCVLITLIGNDCYLDELVLLEEKMPGIAKLQAGKTYQILKDYGATKNRLVINSMGYEMNGIQMVINEDSSISVWGNNNLDEDLWIEFSHGDNIPDGSYYFNDGGYSDEMVSTYIIAENVDNGNVNNWEWISDQHLIVDHNVNNNYILGVKVHAGATDIDKTFYPMLCENGYEKWQPAWRETTDNGKNTISKYICTMSEQEYTEMINRDKVVFDRIIANQKSENGILIVDEYNPDDILFISE